LSGKYLTNGRLIINIFHGIPIKQVALVNLNQKIKKSYLHTVHYNRKIKRLKRKFSNQIFLCATSELTQQLFSRVIGVDKEKLPIVGEARNDILYSNKTNRDYLVKHISRSMQDFTTIFAYTPTWRDKQTWDTGIDFEKMNSFLLQHNCALIIKPHHMDETFSYLDKTYSNIFISNARYQEHHDIYNELVGVDVLISDYSSLIYEFLITNRPILIYTPDYQHYKKMRGFLIEFDTHIPSKRLNNHQDLVQAMLNVINGDYNKDNYNKIRNMFHKHIDSNSSKRVYDEINSRLN
jgi:CDP-glycerol glycerophosphotransferase (TagB/SpsB family)